MNGRRLLAALTLVTTGLVLTSKPASAHDHSHEAPPTDTATPAPLASASDKLGGHLLLHAGGLVSIPFAKLDGGTDFADRAGLGVGAAGDIGFGISRYVALAGWVEYQKFGEASDACACDASALGVGGMLRYHLVQGVRFDPWLSLGAGYRKLDLNNPGVAYSGIDWLRLAIGGDWYAISQVGFGPYAALTLGSFTDRPADTDATVYGALSFGLSIAIDAQGR